LIKIIFFLKKFYRKLANAIERHLLLKTGKKKLQPPADFKTFGHGKFLAQIIRQPQ